MRFISYLLLSVCLSLGLVQAEEPYRYQTLLNTPEADITLFYADYAAPHDKTATRYCTKNCDGMAASSDADYYVLHLGVSIAGKDGWYLDSAIYYSETPPLVADISAGGHRLIPLAYDVGEPSGASRAVTLPIDVYYPDFSEPLTLHATLQYPLCREGTAECKDSTQRLALTIPPKAIDSPAMAALHATKVILSLRMLLVMAFLGGLILNVMPCVLPILSLKILSLTADHARHHRRRSFLLTALGIIVTFALIGSILAIVKQLGLSIGIGFQLQNPYVIIGLCILFTLLTLNLFDVFDIPLPSFIAKWAERSDRLTGALKDLATGAIVTLLATPCGAPFYATATSVALTRESWLIPIIFSVMGLGLAFPYLLMALFPATTQIVPKSGRWGYYIRRFMGLFMGVTAAWLLFIMVSQLGWRVAMTVVLCTILMRFVITHTHPALSGARKFILLLAIGSAAFILPYYIQHENAAIEARVAQQWEPFDPENLARYRAKGRLVFLDFTADWCATCKLNKFLVLERSDVVQYFSAHNVVLMRADLTSPNKKAQDFMISQGHYSIPYNRLYGPGAPEGITFHTFLKRGDIQEAMAKASSR